jgi:hypothetical protein
MACENCSALKGSTAPPHDDLKLTKADVVLGTVTIQRFNCTACGTTVDRLYSDTEKVWSWVVFG